MLKKVKISQNRLLDTQTFIKKANALWNSLYDYSKVEYKSATDKVIVGCRIHGDFKITHTIICLGMGLINVLLKIELV